MAEWQTRGSQKPVRLTPRVGSTPTLGTLHLVIIMHIVLLSSKITEKHISEFEKIFTKPLKDVKLLYVTTSTNYKPYKPDWCIASEHRLQSVFPSLQEFDFERAYKVDKNFDFKKFLSKYDFVFFSGGNTYLLSYWMQKTGSYKIVKDLVQKNKIVYGGESAGAIYTYKSLKPFSSLDHPEIAPKRVETGLGLVNWAVLPHWGDKEYENGLKIIKKNLEKSGVKVYTLNDTQGLFINNGVVKRI